jgi:hypothetical protein
MKIYGYSERGAMNALFYEMALMKDSDKEFVKFLEIANVPNANDYQNFKIYNECSLSRFGTPDLVVVAQRENVNVVFFIEGKVSECSGFRMESIIKEYKDTKKRPNSSNLLFQIRQKQNLYNFRNSLPDSSKVVKIDDKIETSLGTRSIGNNPIVRKFVDVIKNCQEAKYIAIVPDISNEDNEWKNKLEKEGFNELLFISWESIRKNFSSYKLLNDTFEFNEGDDPRIKTPSKKKKSQILNNPIKQITIN